MAGHITRARPRPRLAWIRYGGPISAYQLRGAKGAYRVAILQPWELEAARALKEADPGCTVLAYKCLSSVREYEPGPLYSSGISPDQARRLGTAAGVPEWSGYVGHVQQQVWNPVYQEAWVRAVTEEILPGPFDGVMADNDVYEDYYDHGIDPVKLRGGLDTLVHAAGKALNGGGKILVPNIAESRRDPGRWASHAQYGGGFEECFLGWGGRGDGWLDVEYALAQVEEMAGDGLVIARVPGSTRNYHQHLATALAAAWVFFPERDIAVTATAHDQYSGLPLITDVDLGRPLGAIRREGDTFSRECEGGTAWINLGHEVGQWGLAPHTGLIVPAT